MEDTQAPATPAAPKISAIVLSYNNAAGLRRCLTALEASTARTEMELIVIDNGSVDGSGSLDLDFPNATFLRLPRNFGATKALNIAMRTAVGEYLLYLSPEMEVAPDAAAKLAAYLDDDPDAAAVAPLVTDESGRFAGDLWRLPDSQTLTSSWRSPLPPIREFSADEPAAVEYAGRSALMARKFFVRGINYLDDRYGEFGADLDLAFQIRRAGRKTMLLPAARVTRHAGVTLPPSAQNILAADRANGVAVFLSKHYGAFSSIGFRVSAVLGSLVRFQLGLLAAVAGGSKIDGSQSGL